MALSAIGSHLMIVDVAGQNYVTTLLAMHFGHDEHSDFGERLFEAVSLVLTIGLAWQMAGPLGLTGVAMAAVVADIACGALAFPTTAGATLGTPEVRFYGRMGLGPRSADAAHHECCGRVPVRVGPNHAGREAAAILTAVLAVGIAWPYVEPTVRSLHLRWRT